MKLIKLGFAVGAALLSPHVFAGVNENAVQKVLDQYVPEHVRFAHPTVKNVAVNTKAKTITIECGESTTYVPLTTQQVETLKKEALAALGPKYAKYKVTIKANGFTLDKLASDAKRTKVAPKEKIPFVSYPDAPEAPLGLDGAHIALWQSHGWYFEPKLDRWEWQRARIFQTVEDLYTQSYVMPFLMPMLTNAGAYVMSPRERDIRTEEIIIDNDNLAAGYYESPGMPWRNTPKKGFAYDGHLLVEYENPFQAGTARMVETSQSASGATSAIWSAPIPDSGDYAVYVSYQSQPNSATDARYTIHAANGDHQVRVNQQMGSGTWVYLGHYPFAKGASTPLVELSSYSDHAGTVVSADAVKIGGGIGNVARILKDAPDDREAEYQSSGYPRFTEGSRYFLQWAGAPDSVYTPSDNANDYTDDYQSRGYWVNWLAGGSSVLPKREGLKVPIDLSLAFHTDAGTTMNDTIIGTLGIYCTNKTEAYPNGTSRLAARDFTNLAMTKICDDIRANFEPNWTRRGMWDKSYAEARVPEVPAMLLELLSHQNFADMKYGLDPTFRFTVSRAIYKAMLEYIATRDGREYVVQPLPVRSFAISGDAGKYTLTWAPREDKAEPTAMPTYYIIEERKPGMIGFAPIAQVAEPKYEVTVSDTDIHSYRIVACNDGGASFPSEVLALCYQPGSQQALIVNGFTRVSAPDWFDSGEIAGFYDARDHGVPYINDISFIGSMTEFRREIPWMDDDAAGFGASRSNYETKVLAGNTFDYVAIHGQAMADNGVGFISSSVEAFTAADPATQPRIVDLILGKQKEIKRGTGLYGTDCKTFPSELQNTLRAYTQGGGNVFVSGSFIATDLWDNPHSTPEVREADKKFAAEVLGYKWRTGQASITGEVKEVASRFKAFKPGIYTFRPELNEDMYVVESPDSFYAADSNGATIMRYKENNLVAGTAFAPGGWRTVALGFPFETLTDNVQRTTLMKQVLNFLNAK